MTLAESIEAVAKDERIEAVVIGLFGYWRIDPRDIVPALKLDIPVSWEEARPWLDYDYDGRTCHALCAYTPTRVIVISEGDGFTCPMAVFRHPGEFKPEFV